MSETISKYCKKWKKQTHFEMNEFLVQNCKKIQIIGAAVCDRTKPWEEMLHPIVIPILVLGEQIHANMNKLFWDVELLCVC